MSATCPACGVAVVPGYVKCPKCGAMLPSTRAPVGPGGTAIAGASGGMPVMAFVVGGAVAVAIVLFFALRKGGSEADKPATEPETQVSPESQPTTTPEVAPAAALDNGSAGSAVTAQDPTYAVNMLDKALKKERLWGTVQTSGPRVDVRSGACSDPGMKPLIDANVSTLREGGLTHLRCLSQGGAIVFERDL